ncbi:MAG: M48 family metallopeptidase [Gammaproteobacteria bacterium]|nr:M48 family metallopeptidase [Gammaproteobacteria bacterium]
MKSSNRFSQLFPCVALVILSGCATSPLGRAQLAFFPDSEMNRMGVLAFQEIETKTPIDDDPVVRRQVQCVADSLLNRLGGNADSSAWEVVVFKQDQANAFALPGKKIGVYTGLLKITENQDQLAAVIGHEVAHVIARHANERVSTNYLAQSGAQLIAAMAGGSTTTRNNVMAMLGVGAQVGILLPFGRAQESEADLIGLDLMAKAGFDPRQSVRLWQNMSAAGGRRPPEFLSTHPASATRIRQLQERMPQAMELYEQAGSAGRRPRCW